jgi:hypothetical protein
MPHTHILTHTHTTPDDKTSGVLPFKAASFPERERERARERECVCEREREREEGRVGFRV